MSWPSELTTLQALLAELYPLGEDARRLADQANLPLAHLHLEGPPVRNWHSLLNQAVRHGRLAALLEVVRSEYTEHQPLAEALQQLHAQLAAGAVIPVEAEPPPQPASSVSIGSLSDISGGQVIIAGRDVVLGGPGGRRIPMQLPQRPAHFHGRALELETLLDALRPGGTFTICGPGGMGKTTLAAQAAWQLTGQGQQPPAAFPDGVVFHSFYNQPSAEQALEHIARSFGEEPRPSALQAARLALSGRSALLILDGAENAGDLRQVAAVQGRGAVLITSRDRRDWLAAGLDLHPLALDEALALLGDLAGGCLDDPAAAREICAVLGGLPLAVSIAGHYLKTCQESASAYRGWLACTPLAALDHGAHRQDSLPLLLERSLAQVSPTARQALAVAGCLALAPFDAAALSAALQIDAAQAGRALGELLRFGLLQRPAPNLCQAAHALLHSFARLELPPPPEALERLAAHYTQAAESLSGQGLAGLAGLDLARPHVLALLARLADAGAWQALLDLAWAVGAVGGYLDLQGHAAARLELCQAALNAARRREDRWNEVAWLNILGLVYAGLGEARRAIECYEQALEIAREIGDRRGEGRHLGNLGNAYADLGEARQAIEFYEQALEIAREIGDRRNEGIHLGNLGLAYADLGAARRAIEFCGQALEIAREIGDRRNEGIHLGNLGNAYRNLGEVRRAIEFYEQALEIARQIGDRRGEGSQLGNLGIAYRRLGEERRAIECYEQALEIARQVGDRRNEGKHLSNLGNAYDALGETRRAIEYYEQAVEIARQIGNRIGEGNHLNNLGTIYQSLGEAARARACYEAALSIKRQILPVGHPSIQATEDNLRLLG